MLIEFNFLWKVIYQKAFWSLGWVDRTVLPDSLEITIFGTRSIQKSRWNSPPLTKTKTEKITLWNQATAQLIGKTQTMCVYTTTRYIPTYTQSTCLFSLMSVGPSKSMTTRQEIDYCYYGIILITLSICIFKKWFIYSPAKYLNSCFPTTFLLFVFKHFPLNSEAIWTWLVRPLQKNKNANLSNNSKR